VPLNEQQKNLAFRHLDQRLASGATQMAYAPEYIKRLFPFVSKEEAIRVAEEWIAKRNP